MKLLRQILGPFLALLLAFGSVAEVSAPVTVAAAGVVLGVGHAQAATPAQKAVVLNGVPGWVLRASGALPSIDMDFAHNRAWVGGSGPRAPPSLLTTTRASTGYAQWSDGHLSSFAANVPRITDLGLLVEQAAICLALWNRDLTNANWTASSVTPLKDQVGMDGVGNSASSLLATGSNGTLTAAGITSASASRTVTMGVKRLVGTGAVSISQDGGATFTAITTKVGASWYIPTPTDFAGLTQTVTNPQIVIKLGTSGDKIAVDFVDLEAGALNTSPIATTTVAVTRAADSISATLGSWFVPGQGTMLAKMLLTALPPTGSSGNTFAVIDDGTNANVLQLYMNGGATSTNTIAKTGGVNQYVGGPTGSPSANIAFKIAMRWAASNYGSAVNGGAENTQASGSVPSGLTQIAFGASATGYANGYVQRFAYFRSPLNTTSLTALP